MAEVKKALLIIDMQQGSFTPLVSRFDALGTIRRINQLAARFRQAGQAVIFIQHDGTLEQAFIPGTKEWELLDELELNASDQVISKIANDAFYKSELTEFLKGNDITEVVITGCATDFCVESTVQSALAKDYDVTVVENGHTTGDRPHLSAQHVIAHYNWTWQNMIPTLGSIKLCTAEEVAVF